MSTAGPLDYASSSTPVDVPLSGQPADRGNAAPIDPLLLQQTKNEIRSLVQEITALSQSDVGISEFKEEFLRRVVAALAAQGGAIWTAREDGGLQLDYQINLPQAELNHDAASQRRHDKLLQQVFHSNQPTLVPPQSGAAHDEDAGNPTDYLLIFACLRLDQEPYGVIEIFQRTGGGPTTQRGFLRFLVQMSQLAGEYLKSRRLRQLGDRQTLWEQLEGFLRHIHRQLDSQAAAYTIANESRRLVQCDRVSVAVRRGKQLAITAVSGLDTIDRRAGEIRKLSQLATAVVAAKRPLWYFGERDDLPPQIDEPLQSYVDQSHAKLMGVVPLYPPAPSDATDGDTPEARPLGALIVEQFSSRHAGDGLRERTEVVALHSASALANAIEHESLFLMPLWRTLGKAKWVLQASVLPKTVLALLACLLMLAALALVPTDFDLGARGKLQPAARRDIFAPLDGLVTEVHAQHEQMVRRGDVLVRLANNELEVEIADLLGRQRTNRERIRSLTRAQYDSRLSIEEQNRIAGELLELGQTAESIERELALLREQFQKLEVRSEMDGQVVTWGVNDLLLRRPVNRGQILMTVVDPAGDWELELYMPERRMGHLADASGKLPSGLPVRFMLASHPGQEFPGRVVGVHRVAEVRGEDGNTVLLRVALDRSLLPELRSETSVTARVHCGRRSIGYVLFHELIETLHTRLLFWL